MTGSPGAHSPNPPAHLQPIRTALARCWSSDTSTRWTVDHPARGQCSVTALVVQDLCGGEILKTRLGDGWHFYNLLDGFRVDFTSAQFDGPIAYEDLRASRDEAMSDTTPAQYAALLAAMQRAVRIR